MIDPPLETIAQKLQRLAENDREGAECLRAAANVLRRRLGGAEALFEVLQRTAPRATWSKGADCFVGRYEEPDEGFAIAVVARYVETSARCEAQLMHNRRLVCSAVDDNPTWLLWSLRGELGKRIATLRKALSYMVGLEFSQVDDAIEYHNRFVRALLAMERTK